MNRISVIALAGLLFVLASGCVDSETTMVDSANHPVEKQSSMNESTPSNSLPGIGGQSERKWTAYSATGYSSLNICINDVINEYICLIRQESDPVKIQRTNAVLWSINVSISWDQDNDLSFADREVTLTCEDAAGDCTGFRSPEPVFGQSPLELWVENLDLPANTRLVLDVQIYDPSPDPLQITVDGSAFEYQVTGALLLEELVVS